MPKSNRQRRIVELSREIAILSAILAQLVLEEADNHSTDPDLEEFQDALAEPIAEARNAPIEPIVEAVPVSTPSLPEPSAPYLPIHRSNPPPVVPESTDYHIGDLVEITNRYHNRLGERGHIVAVTTYQVTVRLISDPTILLVKWKTSVRKV